MTIKSDRWIRSQCIHPSRIALPNYGCEGDDYSDIAKPVVGDDCSFKPMIEPFAPQAVRSRKRWQPQDGECVAMVPQYDLRNGGIVTEDKVVSYGVSSFGYDIRAANEWKVFTNINNTLVDPKAFDERCFQTIVGDSVIIPPNSFALARTVEYFRIPRDVLTICLGKSTYARCFTGDTKVALVDGRSLSFEEMAKRAKEGERFFGYTIRPNGSMGVEELVAPRKTGKKERLVSVRLDNGEKIRCTPDHKFMLRDGSYMEAQDLYPGVSLMPLMRYEARGYEMTYCPKHGCLACNHKVLSVTRLKKRRDVYCVTVPNTHNFALEAGVFVHNCGIIVNVTPLEPEWEGYLVLEFSNTTPLPAKLYANEGVAQLLFLQSDEPCEVSYADRGGKYQGQTGVTLPRM